MRKEKRYKNDLEELSHSKGKVAVLGIVYYHEKPGGGIEEIAHQRIVGEIKYCKERTAVSGSDGYDLAFDSLLFLEKERKGVKRHLNTHLYFGKERNPIELYRKTRERDRKHLDTPGFLKDVVYSGITPENVKIEELVRKSLVIEIAETIIKSLFPRAT